ncbi:UBX-domain-containing protein [Hesseltinella vesiculosa]|uniref:UBX-domain-containing protein n=1 Tax=Hesseltinella vesiculosa TaxID=101127 RepID=A0A1X2G4T6_9FUNG|nr:UBX-domain-containing protein [Hesseltinella vesiculosa]
MTSIWFQGDINQAVQLVQQRKCLFIVFLQDESSQSIQFKEMLAQPNMEHELKNHVCLELVQPSDNATLFGQIYPTQRVPMLYFIQDGVVKDVAIETMPADELVSKLQHWTAIAQPSEPPTPSQSSPVDPSIVTPSPQPATIDPESLQEKKEKLKQKMEQARQKVEKKEKDEAKQRELKRRQDGKDAQKTRDHLEDEQTKRHYAKIKQDKMADEERRRKIKEKIAHDRAEQKKKRLEQLQPTPTHIPTVSSRSSDDCNLNIRQTDGNNIKHKFKAVDTLEMVREWIDTHRTDGDQPFKLLAQFPTRQFSVGEENQTLRDLGLVPSSTLIMKQTRNVATAYGAGSSVAGYTGTLFNYTYSAGEYVYNTLTGVLGSVFGTNPRGPTVGGGSTLGGDAAQSNPSNEAGRGLGTPLASTSSAQIHGMDQFRGDDKEKLYNGNSLNQE